MTSRLTTRASRVACSRRNCLFSKKIPCCNNKYGTNMRTISIDDMNIENDNCCFCYYDALTRQLPAADSMENLNINKLSRKKSHVKLIRANFTSDVSQSWKQRQ